MHPAYFETRFLLERFPSRIPARNAILSAFATTGEKWSDDRNHSADQRLYETLIERGYEAVRIIGYSPNTEHAEPSWLVEMEESEAIAIGRKFLQHAVYLVINDELSVVLCEDESLRCRIGSFRERIDVAREGALPPSPQEEHVPRELSP
jgi:hypothetical protein